MADPGCENVARVGIVEREVLRLVIVERRRRPVRIFRYGEAFVSDAAEITEAGVEGMGDVVWLDALVDGSCC